MKLNTFSITLVLAVIITLSACQKTPEKEQTEDAIETSNQIEEKSNTSDFYGIYQGIIPCADCEGIKTKITLLKDGSFNRTTEYLGKSEETFRDKGAFVENNQTSTIKVDLKDGGSQLYEIAENKLYHLDQEGNRITGELADNYMLLKNLADSNLENKTWVAIEIMGQQIAEGDNKKEMTLMFMSENGLLTGSDGCNRFNGGYELLKGNRYKSGPFATTMMACENMEMSQQYLQMLEKADTYIITDSILSITKGRMAIMAKFKVRE